MCFGMILTKTQSLPYDIITYDPAWVRRYEAEASAVKGIFGSRLLNIEHVGGTSVPGLSARPAIDLLAVIHDMEGIREQLRQLAMLGYIDKGDRFDNGSRFLSKMGMVNLYIFPDGHPEAARQLEFRDYLRLAPAVIERHNRGEIELEALYAEWRS